MLLYWGCVKLTIVLKANYVTNNLWREGIIVYECSSHLSDKKLDPL